MSHSLSSAAVLSGALMVKYFDILEHCRSPNILLGLKDRYRAVSSGFVRQVLQNSFDILSYSDP